MSIFSKAGPLLGTKKLNQLNKNGKPRLPSNMKGLPAMSKGGLGGAARMKLPKFAKGGMVSGGGGLDELLGGNQEIFEDAVDAPGGIASLPSTPDYLDEESRPEGGLSTTAPTAQKPPVAAPSKALEAYQRASAGIQQMLAANNASKVNIPMMQLGASLLKGAPGMQAWGEGIGNMATGYTQKQKQDMDNIKLYADLANDDYKTASGAPKLAADIGRTEADTRRLDAVTEFEKNDRVRLAEEKIAAANAPKPPKTSAYIEKTIDKFVDEAAGADMASTEARTAASYLDDVNTGSMAGSAPGVWAQKLISGEDGEAKINAVEKATARVKAEAALVLKTPGAVSDLENKLYSAASGADMNVGEGQLKKNLEAYALVNDLKAVKANVWNQVADTMSFPDFKRKWVAGEFDHLPEVQQIKAAFEEGGFSGKGGAGKAIGEASEKVKMITPDGRTVFVPRDKVDEAVKQGGKTAGSGASGGY